ncbi:MAG TPA: hypothetical protein VIC62_04715 [Nakamurella sp.]
MPARVRSGATPDDRGGGQDGRHGRLWWRVGGAATGIAVVIVLVLAAWWLNRADSGSEDPTSGTAEPIWDRPAVAADELAQRSGVRITQVAVTGNGGLVDLRYQVVDPQAANSLHDPALPPGLIDEQTGLVVHDLLMNHAHTGLYHQGETYYLVFENPDNWIRSGSEVTVLLGAVEARHITVQ